MPGIAAFSRSFFQNALGQNERWIRGNQGWYFITPNGSLHPWRGKPDTAFDVTIASLDPIYYYRPELLYNASDEDYAYVLDQELQLTFTGNLSENALGEGERWLRGEFGHWFYVKPDGGVYFWTRTLDPTNDIFVAQLDPIYHTEIERLHDASSDQFEVTIDPSTSTLDVQIENGYVGTFFVRAMADDGIVQTTELLEVMVTPGATAVTNISPSNGEESVNVTRETTVRFSDKIDPATITTDSFYVMAQGEKVPGTVRVSSTGMFAQYFYDTPPPSSTEVRVVVDGNRIEDATGKRLDPDGDGVPGGRGTADFRTLPLTFLADTAVTGKVLQSNAVDENGQPVDMPVEGVTIFLEGRPDVNAVTNVNGEFTLTSPEGLPAPDFFVVIDGSTAIGVPDGFVYPTLGKPFHSIPGQTVPLRMTDGTEFDIYLPLMNTQDIQQLDDTNPTNVGFGPGGLETLNQLFPNVAPEVWERTKVVFEPGSAQDDQGNAATQAAIVPVAPNRIPAPLPEFLDPGLVISIQAGGDGGFNDAGGATQFDVPAEVAFPNLEGLAPGEQALVFSFDHDAGEWIVVGTGTVSEDGLMVESDGGVILAPGWHFVARGTSARFLVGETLGNVCGAGDDFLHGDDPGLSANPLKAALQLSARLDAAVFGYPTAASLPMKAELRAAGSGPLGDVMVDRFLSPGSSASKQFDHLPGSVLSNAVKGNSEFQRQVQRVRDGIDFRIQRQAENGYVDNVELTTNASIFGSRGKLVAPAIDFSQYYYYVGGGPETAILGSTQGGQLFMSDWSVTVSSLGGGEGSGITGMGTYTAKLSWELCDDFGVDYSDLYTIELAAFWVAQHEAGFTPFVNRVVVDIDEPITGTFVIPEQYTEFDDRITASIPPQSFGSQTFGFSPQALAQPAQVVQTQVITQQNRISGFGTDPRIYYRIVPDSGVEISGIIPEPGIAIDQFFPTGEPFTVYLYQPSTNMGSVFASSFAPASGQETRFSGGLFGSEPPVGELLLGEIDQDDFDGDGIPDVGERAIGTSSRQVDSDNDGIPDGAELEQGLNPLDGFASTTGVVASVDISSNAEAVDVVGDFAYVAAGSNITITDVSQFDQPIIEGRLQLSGTARDVSVDDGRNIAAVATGLGVQLIDVSDPMQPTLIETVTASASKVEVYNGFVYALAGRSMTVLDIVSGDIVSQLELPGSGNVTDMAREANTLFAYVSGSDTLVAIDISLAETPQVLGQLNVSVASSDVGVFVGTGIVWLAGSGFRTIDVSDPANMSLIQTPGNFFTAQRVALNGSGLGLLLPDGGNFVQVYDTSDPTNTNNLVTQFNLSGRARDLKISRGIAYVVVGNRLDVVNYRSFDALGQAPTANIQTDAQDQDPQQDGIQVLEGTRFVVQGVVTDDVQVRQVELLQNGQIVATDTSFPFDFFVTTPPLSEGIGSLGLQIRATDTGGNSTLSEIVTVNIVPDTIAPTVVNVMPTEGGQVGEGERTLRVRFSESINPDNIAETTVTLVGLGDDSVLGTVDDVIIPVTTEFRDADQLLQIATGEMTPGEYQLQIVEPDLVDLAGNSLGDDVFVSAFTVVEVTSRLMGNPPTVLFVIDVSGSTGNSFGGDVIGDPNNDGASDTILDAEIAALSVLNQEIINLGLGDTAQIGIIPFTSEATARDMDLFTAGTQFTTTPTADNNNNGIRDVEEILMTLRDGGGTNFGNALGEVINVFNTLNIPNGTGNIVLISDGESSGGFLDEVAVLQDRSATLIAFGAGNSASLAQLRQIDPLAGRFTNPDEIIDLITNVGEGN
ncbi:MAG: Ig-like domain-containing protein [Gemmataceae bacterium]